MGNFVEVATAQEPEMYYYKPPDREHVIHIPIDENTKRLIELKKLQDLGEFVPRSRAPIIIEEIPEEEPEEEDPPSVPVKKYIHEEPGEIKPPYVPGSRIKVLQDCKNNDINQQIFWYPKSEIEPGVIIWDNTIFKEDSAWLSELYKQVMESDESLQMCSRLHDWLGLQNLKIYNLDMILAKAKEESMGVSDEKEPLNIFDYKLTEEKIINLFLNKKYELNSDQFQKYFKSQTYVTTNEEKSTYKNAVCDRKTFSEVMGDLGLFCPTETSGIVVYFITDQTLPVKGVNSAYKSRIDSSTSRNTDPLSIEYRLYNLLFNTCKIPVTFVRQEKKFPKVNFMTYMKYNLLYKLDSMEYSKTLPN
jgi:hypothetical protein